MGTVHQLFKKTEETEKQESDVDFQALFDDAIKRNKENKHCMQHDRRKANKSVLRSYRIKD